MSMAEQSESTHKSQRRTGLGRGLGALIPPAQTEKPEDVAKRPLDVLFPGERRSSGTVRGGSARELLEPKSRTAKSASLRRVHRLQRVPVLMMRRLRLHLAPYPELFRLNLRALLIPRIRERMGPARVPRRM